MTALSSRGLRLWLGVILGTVVAVPALVLVLGWGAGIDRFTRLAPGLAAMVPSTAASFILLAGALFLCPTRWQKPALRTASLVVAAIAAADLVVTLSGTANGIDALFMPQLANRPHDAMSVATATCFLLASACTFLLAGPDALARYLYVPIATVGLLLCSVALIGYAFNAAALYKVFIFVAMALHTAALFALLFVALMLSYGRGWIWLLLGEGTGSAGARRLFPIVVAGPLVLCLLARSATRAGYISDDFRLMLLALMTMTFALVAILYNAAIENRIERQLTGVLADLEATSADKDLLIREIYHRVKNNLQQINALIAIESARHLDDGVRASFEEMSGRVQALGLVHQLLMQSARPSEIDIAPFLEELGQNIARSHGLKRRGITLSLEAQSETVHLDASITIGLLVNELVVNAIKHAFTDRTNGKISICYRRDPDDDLQRQIAVNDNGRGTEDLQAVLLREQSGGTRIVRSLVTQLRGDMRVEVDNGTHITISFPAEIYQENRYAAE